jgi:hypothetical protein
MAVTLGKDVRVDGVSGARSCSISNTANEVECTTFADGAGGFRKYKKALIEQTCEVECVDAPGKNIGETFTLGLTGMSTANNIEFVITSIAKAEPLDGIETYTVSASRHKTQT